jgi:hypothetical protein
VAVLTIPERFREGIVKVAEISEAGFNQLRDALGRAPECNDSTELNAWITGETDEIPPRDREAIVAALAPMTRVQRSSETTPSKFISDVWESLNETSPELTKTTSAKVFKSRLAELIEKDAFDLPSTKLADLKREIERSFCKVRVLTDLRPAFKADLDESPTAMVVLHNFQIGYHDGMGKHHEFYITLDQSDIETLRKALDRAEAKSKSLGKTLAKANISLFE